MATVTSIPSPAEITITVSDMSVAEDISRLLKRVSGITNIRVKRSKNEVELALEEAHRGEIKGWNSVDDYLRRYYFCQERDALPNRWILRPMTWRSEVDIVRVVYR